METQAESNHTTATTTTTTTTNVTTDEMSTIKDLRRDLETRITTRHTEQQELISSLSSLVPDLVSSLNLSLHVISSFNRRPFSPLPTPNPTHPKKPPLIHHLPRPHYVKKPETKGAAVEGGRSNAMGVVRGVVAGCLLERVPFSAIDSSTVARKVENDEGVSAAERAAVREVGGEDGTVAAVEAALRCIARDSGGVELEEEFVVSGKARVMVMSVDRVRLVKEVPAGKKVSVSVGPVSSSKGGMGRGVGPRGGMPGQHQQQMRATPYMGGVKQKVEEEEEEAMVKALLDKKSFMEMQKSKTGEELLDLIHRPTAKETAVAAKVVRQCVVF